MEYDHLLLQRLLYESASDTLIFRPGDYKFEGALNLERSQILRDILGIANSWRRSDSYILIGVEGINPGQHKILGIMDHLDENKVVEFVNSKVQKPISFRYQAYMVERKKIGLIHIPLQERPFFLKEDYANLKKYVIYVRRGELVQEADTAEVAKIKEFSLPETKAEPLLKLEFANSKKKIPLGKQLTMKTFLIEIPGKDSLPDLEISGSRLAGKINKPYYRELADHFQQIGRVSVIDFCVANSGPKPAHEVRLKIHIEDPDEKYFVREAFEIPHRPEKDRGLSCLKPVLQSWNEGMRVRRKNRLWEIDIQFGEIKPQETVFSSHAVYIGSRASLSMDMHAILSAGNLLQPLHIPLAIDIQIQKRKLEKDVICK